MFFLCILYGFLVDIQDIDYYVVFGVRRIVGYDEVRLLYKVLMLELYFDRNRVNKD